MLKEWIGLCPRTRKLVLACGLLTCLPLGVAWEWRGVLVGAAVWVVLQVFLVGMSGRLLNGRRHGSLIVR
jgi:hypothetical protein